MNSIPQGSASDHAIARYLHRQRSLGRAHAHGESVIDALRRFLEKSGFVDLDQAVFEAWCVSQGHLTPRLPYRRPQRHRS